MLGGEAGDADLIGHLRDVDLLVGDGDLSGADELVTLAALISTNVFFDGSTKVIVREPLVAITYVPGG